MKNSFHRSAPSTAILNYCCYQIMSRVRKLVRRLVNDLFWSRLSKLITIPDWLMTTQPLWAFCPSPPWLKPPLAFQGQCKQTMINTAISKKVALVMPVKHKFTMHGPRRCHRRCLSSLLFIPCLKFPLTIRIYLSALRAMKHGPCIMHYGSQEQPILK